MNNNLKMFLMLILGMIISYSTVAIADTYINSNEVYYDNETSGGTYTNVKESIDELYNLASHNGSTFGDAIASDILSGKTALSGGEEITGSMVNNGGVTKSIGVGETYTIPQGYHDGTGKVTNSVANKGAITGTVGVGGTYSSTQNGYVSTIKVTGPTLSGTAGVGDVRSGKTFYNTSGSIQTGTWSPSASVTLKASARPGGYGTSISVTKGAKYILAVGGHGSGESTNSCSFSGGTIISQTGNTDYYTCGHAWYFTATGTSVSYNCNSYNGRTFYSLWLIQ